jgi:hypothetical protein
MQTDMISEVLSAVELFRGGGQGNQSTRDFVAGVFGCDARHPTFFYQVAALLGQFDFLETQITRSTHLTEHEKAMAVGHVRSLSNFLQPERLVRSWQESREQMFQPHNFGIQLMRHTLASEFPMQSLSKEDVEALLPKIKEAISDIVRSGAPVVVVQALTNAMEAVLRVLEHFRFYGAQVLTEKVIVAFATAESCGRSLEEPTRRAAHVSKAGLAAIALTLLIQSNEAIHAMQDWSERGQAAIEHVAAYAQTPLLPAPVRPSPEAIQGEADGRRTGGDPHNEPEGDPE